MSEEMRELKHDLSKIFVQDGFDTLTKASDCGLIDFMKNDFKHHPPTSNQELVKYQPSKSWNGKMSSLDIKSVFSSGVIAYNISQDELCEGKMVQDPRLDDPFGMNESSMSKMFSVNHSNAVGQSFNQQSSTKDGLDSLVRDFDYERGPNRGYSSPNIDERDPFNFDEYGENSLSRMWGESSSYPAKKGDFEDSFDFEKSHSNKKDEENIFSSFSRPQDRLPRQFNSNEGLSQPAESQSNPTQDDSSAPVIESSKRSRKLRGIPTEKMQEEKSPKPSMQTRGDIATGNYRSRVSSTPEIEDGDDDEKSGKRGSNGLRIISRRVVEILNEKHETSFTDVADILVNEMKKRARFLKQDSLEKEEKNLKRRVYDALNVLIASGVIEKVKKKVILKEKQNGISKLSRYHQISAQTQEKIKIIKERRKQKLEELQELISKNLAVSNVIQRNKKNNSKTPNPSKAGSTVKTSNNQLKCSPSAKTTTSSNENSNSKPESLEGELQQANECFHFPLLFISTAKRPSAGNSKGGEEKVEFKFETSAGCKEMLIESNRPFEVLGDIDFLLKMNFQKVAKESFSKYLKKDLLKYLPKNYFK